LELCIEIHNKAYCFVVNVDFLPKNIDVATSTVGQNAGVNLENL